MAVTIDCGPDTLAKASACLGPLCLGPDDREAIDVFVRVQELAAIGGTDYRNNLAQLVKDTKGYGKLDEDTRRRIALQLDIYNAINKGATFDSTINGLKVGAKCYLCLPWEQRRNIKLFLKCQLNKLSAPE